MFCQGLHLLSLEVSSQLANTFLAPLLVIEQRAATLVVSGSDLSGGNQYGVLKISIMRAYSILVSLVSAMAGRPRSRSRVSVLLGRVGAELG